MTNTDTADALGTRTPGGGTGEGRKPTSQSHGYNDDMLHRAAGNCHRLVDMGVSVPLIGDFHYTSFAAREIPATAKPSDKYRINPGNVGGKAATRIFERSSR